MDALGEAFGDYRAGVYDRGFTGRRSLAPARVAAFCRDALVHVDRSLDANRRPDGLYDTYNLLEPRGDDGLAITRLPEMLEGQVAILSSGALSPEDSLAVLDALHASTLYRAEQRSFLLYPAQSRPGFLSRNVVPGERVREIGLLRQLLEAGDRSLIARDPDGVHRFHGDLQEASDVDRQLDALAQDPARAEAVARDRAAVLDLFEDVFHHRSYLGRSGVMYGYEGLGCIYWHMVAKLLLAVQENVQRAGRENAPARVRQALERMYFRVRSGIGYEKTVAEYGAFPTDPYSHTAPDGGARQPGMTGQVKEEILTRLGELGVEVEDGMLHLRPRLLRADEFHARPAVFDHVGLDGRPRTLELETGTLAFTLCQVPVIYALTSGEPRIRVDHEDGASSEWAGDALDRTLTARILGRRGGIACIRVDVPEVSLTGA
jgi:hypothetical protein